MIPSSKTCLRAVAGGFALLAASAALAQTAGDAPSNNWLVTCTNQGTPDRLACTMSQNIVQKQTGDRIASFQIVRGADGPVVNLVLPFGARLRDGVELLIDAKSVAKLPYVSALNVGLVAETPLTKEMLPLLRNGKIAAVKLVNMAGNPVEVQIDLIGFSRAYDLFSSVGG